jgi:RHS repeat-associated protein
MAMLQIVAWTNNTGSVNIPDTLTVNSRTGNTPSEYKARAEIRFTAGFESATGDYFVAYITDEAGGGGGSGSGTSNSSEGNGYRYGFNGKENDNDVKGEGNQQDYGMRIYDTRLGRFLSVDPLTRKYPYYSPYQFSGIVL